MWQRVVKDGEEKVEEGREEKTLAEAAVGVAVVGAGVIGQDEVGIVRGAEEELLFPFEKLSRQRGFRYFS